MKETIQAIECSPVARWVSVVIGALIVFMVGSASLKEFVSPAPIVKLEQESSASPSVVSGKGIEVKVWDAERRPCPVAVYQYLTDQEDNTFNVSGPLGAGGRAHEASAKLIQDAQQLPAGQYELFITVVYECPSRSHLVTQIKAKLAVMK